MNRGNACLQIFFDDADYYLFINALHIFSLRYKIVVIAFSIMPNHFHLFLYDPEGKLSEFMHDMLSTFASNYNRKNNRVGHVFQGRFKSQVVDSSRYARDLSRYIHLNPVNTRQYVEASIEEKAKLLKEFRWSSLAYYLSPGVVKEKTWFNPREILDQFGSDRTEQIKNYMQYVVQGLAMSPDDIRSMVFDHVVEQCVIGDGMFLDKIKDEVRAIPTTNPKAAKLTSVPLDTLEKSVMLIPSINYENLHSRGRGRTAYRNAIIYLASNVSMSKATLTDIGKHFGGLTVSSVSRIIRKVNYSFTTNGIFRNLLLCMEECLYSRSYNRFASLDISCIRTAYG
jgi:REP element-mobilizing transposase RayT